MKRILLLLAAMPLIAGWCLPGTYKTIEEYVRGNKQGYSADVYLSQQSQLTGNWDNIAVFYGSGYSDMRPCKIAAQAMRAQYAPQKFTCLAANQD